MWPSVSKPNMPCGCVLLAYVGLSIFDGLPRTIHYRIEAFENKSWGFHHVERESILCTTSVSADGSRHNRCFGTSSRYWVIPQKGFRVRTLYARPAHAGYEIDDANRTATGGPCSCTWTAPSLLLDDKDCLQSAKRLLGHAQPAGEGLILGHRVIRFTARRRTLHRRDAETETIALAPDLGCEALEHSDYTLGFLGIPYRGWRYRVLSYEPGEPQASTLQLPADYQVRAPSSVVLPGQAP
jgi:hypothetical protein